MIFKNRKAKLYQYIDFELNSDSPDITNIMHWIDEYEKNNLETIEKLKREKSLTTKKISGALKQTINSHGPITKILIGSATKRIYGALLESKKETKIKKFLKWIKKLLN